MSPSCFLHCAFRWRYQDCCWVAYHWWSRVLWFVFNDDCTFSWVCFTEQKRSCHRSLLITPYCSWKLNVFSSSDFWRQQVLISLPYDLWYWEVSISLFMNFYVLLMFLVDLHFVFVEGVDNLVHVFADATSYCCMFGFVPYCGALSKSSAYFLRRWMC